MALRPTVSSRHASRTGAVTASTLFSAVTSSGPTSRVGDGGEDTGPTPTELFIASLAGCVAFYARRYLDRHDQPTEGLTVEAELAVS